MPRNLVAAKASNNSQKSKKKEKNSQSSTTASKTKSSMIKSKLNKKNAPAKGGIKKEAGGRKWRPGTVALREIKKYQKSVACLMPRAPFYRLVRDVTHSISPDMRFTPDSLQAIQEASEAYLVQLFESSNLCALATTLAT